MCKAAVCREVSRREGGRRGEEGFVSRPTGGITPVPAEEMTHECVLACVSVRECVCVCVCVCRVQVSVCTQLWPRTRRYTAQRPTPHEHVICISQCAILLSYLTRVHPPLPRPAADPPSPVGRGCFFFVFFFRSGNSGPPPGGAHCYL